MTHYDVIIVGAGAGGGIVAGVLAEAGKHVLLLERGGWIDLANTGRDHLRNQRISLYGHNAGPDIDGKSRVLRRSQGEATTVRPHEGGYNNNAAAVGGGTRGLRRAGMALHGEGLPNGDRVRHAGGQLACGLADLIPGSGAVLRARRVGDRRLRRGDGNRLSGAPAQRVSDAARTTYHDAISTLGAAPSSRMEHISDPACHQHRAARRPRGLHPVRSLRRVRLPVGCEERHAEHHDSASAQDRAVRSGRHAMAERIDTDAAASDRRYLSGSRKTARSFENLRPRGLVICLSGRHRNRHGCC